MLDKKVVKVFIIPRMPLLIAQTAALFLMIWQDFFSGSYFLPANIGTTAFFTLQAIRLACKDQIVLTEG